MSVKIDLSSVTDRDDENDQTSILDFGDDPIVTDAISPLSCPIRGQRFSMDPRVGAANEVFFDPFEEKLK